MPELTIKIEGDDDDGSSKPAAQSESIEALRQRGDQATAEAARLRHEAAHHRANAARSRVVTELNRHDIERHQVQSEYRNALEAGDIDTQAAAQGRMVAIEAKCLRLQEQAEALEKSPLVQHSDPVEALCATRTEPTARWLREHRDWVVDPKKNAKLTSAHFDAVAEGLREDSPEYFQHVERRIGLNDGSQGARSGSDRSSGRPPAKIDPGNPNTHVMRGGAEVFLTKGEKEAALDGQTHVLGRHDLVAGRIRNPNLIGKAIGVPEMARRKAQMVRDGWYNRLES